MKNFAVIKPEIEALITPALAKLGLEVYEINETKDYDGEVLQVLVDTLPDNHQALDFDLLVKANETVSDLLDTFKGLQDNYLLEVASVGLEKPIRSEAELEKAIGEYVQITLKEKPKQWLSPNVSGTLESDGQIDGHPSFQLKFFIKGRPKTIKFQWNELSAAQFAVKF